MFSGTRVAYIITVDQNPCVYHLPLLDGHSRLGKLRPTFSPLPFLLFVPPLLEALPISDSDPYILAMNTKPQIGRVLMKNSALSPRGKAMIPRGSRTMVCFICYLIMFPLDSFIRLSFMNDHPR